MKHFTERQRQWGWFVLLWLVGWAAMFTLAQAIRWLMGIE